MSTKETMAKSEGNMTIKRALFLGGAVLVLAACADATAPVGARQGGSVAASKKANPQPGTTTPKTSALPTTNTATNGECRGGGGYTVVSGRDSTETEPGCGQ